MIKEHVWREYLLAGGANIGLVVAGMCMGWTSPIEAKLRDPENSPLGRPVTTSEMSLIGSLLVLGSAIGPLIGGYSNSIIGRKYSIMVASIPMLTSWILLFTTATIPWIYAARILCGIANGILLTVTNMYIAEIASPPVRGALTSFLQISLMVGMLLVNTIVPYTSYNFITYCGAVITVTFVLIFFFFPESPIYFMSRDERDKAKDSLMKIRGKCAADVLQELDKMQADYEEERKQDKAKLSDLWMSIANRKAFFICFGIFFFQQLCGIGIVTLFLGSIFNAANTNLAPELSTIIVGVVQVVSSSVTPLVVDRLGRRMLLLISAMGMTISLGFLGFFFYLQHIDSPLVETLSALPLISMMAYIIVYCVGFGPLPWVIMGESFSIGCKAVATPIVTVLGYMIGFLITLFYGNIAESFGLYVPFWIFAACCLVGFIFTLFLVPETKGKSLWEIQDMLNNSSSGCHRVTEDPTQTKDYFFTNLDKKRYTSEI